jgi:hypothetical protein
MSVSMSFYYGISWYQSEILQNHKKAAPQLKRLVAFFPPRRPGFNLGSGQVGFFVVDKVAPGQVFSEYSGFPCHSFHQILHPHNHPGQVQ